MRFKPMYFGKTDCAVTQANRSHALQLSPTPFTKPSPQNRKNANATSDCDCFNIRDLPDNLKVHGFILCQAYSQDSTDS